MCLQSKTQPKLASWWGTEEQHRRLGLRATGNGRVHKTGGSLALRLHFEVADAL